IVFLGDIITLVSLGLQEETSPNNLHSFKFLVHIIRAETVSLDWPFEAKDQVNIDKIKATFFMIRLLIVSSIPFVSIRHYTTSLASPCHYIQTHCQAFQRLLSLLLTLSGQTGGSPCPITTLLLFEWQNTHIPEMQSSIISLTQYSW
ncbi:MAG TPA: hypothetical protein VK616_07960, partial [Flavitalea sp.]|nr:hypothetical protein [Flavitalea sp.]